MLRKGSEQIKSHREVQLPIKHTPSHYTDGLKSSFSQLDVEDNGLW